MFGAITATAERLASTAAGGRLGALAGVRPGSASPRPYSLQTLIDGLEDPFPLLGGPPRSTEQSTVWTLRNKLIRLGRSGMLDWTSTARTPELPVDELLVEGRLSILDVSETDDTSRNIAISYLLQ